MNKVILEGDDRYHMPSLFVDKILYCKAPLQDMYFEEQGGWVLTQTERRTAYRNYSVYVSDFDFEKKTAFNEKKIDIVDNEGDVFCSPHAYLRSDGLIELTYIRVSVLGKVLTKPMNNMYKTVLDKDFNVLSKPVKVKDCFVQDCYCGVENSRFRACSTPVISKPVIYIFDKMKSYQYRLKIGQIPMIQRISTVYGSDSDLLFTSPSDKTSNGQGIYEHFVYNLDRKEIKKVIINNENPYKMSINSNLQAVWSERYGFNKEYKMRIKSGLYEFAQARINTKIDKERRRQYLWQ